MEVSNSLLVAIMFTIILSLGIANILMTLATMVDKRTIQRTYWLQTSWMVLFLLVYFNMFWQMIAIFEIEDWEFLSFMYMISGPILLFFSSQVLLPDATEIAASDLRDHYYGVHRQFFSFLALTQAWIIGVDFILGGGLTSMSYLNLVAGVLALILALSSQPSLHRFGAGVAWPLFLVAVVLQGMGIL